MVEPQLRGGELTSTNKKKERLKIMKLLAVWSWAPKDSKEVVERFTKWTPKGKWETLYPVSTMIGMNKGFQIVEVDDIGEMQKSVAEWTDILTFKFIPIMDSTDAIAVSQ